YLPVIIGIAAAIIFIIVLQSLGIRITGKAAVSLNQADCESYGAKWVAGVNGYVDGQCKGEVSSLCGGFDNAGDCWAKDGCNWEEFTILEQGHCEVDETFDNCPRIENEEHCKLFIDNCKWVEINEEPMGLCEGRTYFYDYDSGECTDLTDEKKCKGIEECTWELYTYAGPTGECRVKSDSGQGAGGSGSGGGSNGGSNGGDGQDGKGGDGEGGDSAAVCNTECGKKHEDYIGYIKSKDTGCENGEIEFSTLLQEGETLPNFGKDKVCCCSKKVDERESCKEINSKYNCYFDEDGKPIGCKEETGEKCIAVRTSDKAYVLNKGGVLCGRCLMEWELKKCPVDCMGYDKSKEGVQCSDNLEEYSAGSEWCYYQDVKYPLCCVKKEDFRCVNEGGVCQKDDCSTLEKPKDIKLSTLFDGEYKKEGNWKKLEDIPCSDNQVCCIFEEKCNPLYGFDDPICNKELGETKCLSQTEGQIVSCDSVSKTCKREIFECSGDETCKSSYGEFVNDIWRKLKPPTCVGKDECCYNSGECPSYCVPSKSPFRDDVKIKKEGCNDGACGRYSIFSEYKVIDVLCPFIEGLGCIDKEGSDACNQPIPEAVCSCKEGSCPSYCDKNILKEKKCENNKCEHNPNKDIDCTEEKKVCIEHKTERYGVTTAQCEECPESLNFVAKTPDFHMSLNDGAHKAFGNRVYTTENTFHSQTTINGVFEKINDVCERCISKKGNNFLTVIFDGHGYPGKQEMGNEQFNSTKAKEMAEKYPNLKKCIKTFVFNGCSVGGGSKGKKFKEEMGNSFGANVEASPRLRLAAFYECNCHYSYCSSPYYIYTHPIEKFIIYPTYNAIQYFTTDKPETIYYIADKDALFPGFDETNRYAYQVNVLEGDIGEVSISITSGGDIENPENKVFAAISPDEYFPCPYTINNSDTFEVNPSTTEVSLNGFKLSDIHVQENVLVQINKLKPDCSDYIENNMVNTKPVAKEEFDEVEELYNEGLLLVQTYDKFKILYENEWACLEDSDCEGSLCTMGNLFCNYSCINGQCEITGSFEPLSAIDVDNDGFSDRPIFDLNSDGIDTIDILNALENWG
ncbi:MAG: DUF4347 domain-containing protein, partial [Nanoarchaeota archaeon]|nr:DUF4347 domain-containing protein [Nanoarchaeota archaeon]